MFSAAELMKDYGSSWGLIRGLAGDRIKEITKRFCKHYRIYRVWPGDNVVKQGSWATGA